MSERTISEAMTVWCGWWRETEVHVTAKILPCGAAEIECLECGGDGDWTKFHPALGPVQCTDCKGTGRMLVSGP